MILLIYAAVLLGLCVGICVGSVAAMVWQECRPEWHAECRRDKARKWDSCPQEIYSMHPQMQQEEGIKRERTLNEEEEKEMRMRQRELQNFFNYNGDVMSKEEEK